MPASPCTPRVLRAVELGGSDILYICNASQLYSYDGFFIYIYCNQIADWRDRRSARAIYLAEASETFKHAPYVQDTNCLRCQASAENESKTKEEVSEDSSSLTPIVCEVEAERAFLLC